MELAQDHDPYRELVRAILEPSCSTVRELVG
jgi:hypothetical protein